MDRPLLTPSPDEMVALRAVRSALTSAILADERISLPPFDGRDSSFETAHHLIGIEPNPYGGTIGPYRYQFEGEEDLLHLIVARSDGAPLSPEEGQAVASHVIAGVTPGLVWFKPGHYTQHFSFGHDELLDAGSL